MRNIALSVRAPLSAMMIIFIASIFINTAAEAHEQRPAIVTAEISPAGEIEIRLAMNIEALIAGIDPEHSNTDDSDKEPMYERLRVTTQDGLKNAFMPMADDLATGLRVMFDGEMSQLKFERLDVPPIGDTAIARVSTVILSTTIPPEAKIMNWSGDPRLGDNVIRVARTGETTPYFSAFLSTGEISPPISLAGVVKQNAWAGFLKYISIGFDHILPKGLDHILFIVSLFLLSPYIKPLLWQVTSFTLAHSVTLGLGIYGLVSVPASIVEPLIAASIVFVAIENLFTNRLHRWRPAIIFGFGLLHGLGFAGVLTEVGLPPSQFASALIGFNIGVELGQLAVLAVCFICIGLQFRNRQWYRQAVTIPASLAVACVATYWFIERISL